MFRESKNLQNQWSNFLDLSILVFIARINFREDVSYFSYLNFKKVPTDSQGKHIFLDLYGFLNFLSLELRFFYTKISYHNS